MKETYKMLLQDGFLDGMQPAFAVEESSKRLVFVNQVIQNRLGDVTGQTCHQAFWGSDTPCAFCPESRPEGKSYHWDCVSGKGDAFKVCTLWKQEETVRYRLSMATDTSDIMCLNRSVVDYLCLMQQLSAFQMKLTDDPSHTTEVILQFLRQHFQSRATAALRIWSDGRQDCIVCKQDGICPPTGKTPDGIKVITIPLPDGWCEFWLDQPNEPESIQQQQGIIWQIVRLYMENEVLREQVGWDSCHDSMTRLYNRAALGEKKHFYDQQPSLAVFFFDLNNLKQTNDVLGHAMGDGLIRRMANVLRRQCVNGISAYRMGGDEFVLIAPVSRSEAEALRLRLDEGIRQETGRQGDPPLCVSLGWSFQEAPVQTDQLIQLADQRMYEDKRRYHAAASSNT